MNRQRAKERYKRVRQTEEYKVQQGTAVRFRRRMGDLTPELKDKLRKRKSVGRSKPAQLTARQQYWLRRRPLLLARGVATGGGIISVYIYTPQISLP